MNAMRALPLWLAVVTLIAGCQTVSSDYDRPARIVRADDASRTALQQAVNNLLHTNVTLSDSALINSSMLTIENRPQPTMENPVPLGRDYARPMQLQLVINGTDCVLVNQQDRSRYLVPNTSCEAE